MNKPSTKTTNNSSSSSWGWVRPSSQYPQSPGVYWFVSKKNEVLYVGKAKNLKKRIYSYQKISQKHKKTFSLVKIAKKINFQVLDSELDALIVEAQLISAHQPKYNTLLKDDKTPLYIVITNEPFPRVITARKKQLLSLYKHLPKTNIFGPFTNSTDAKRIIKISRRIFKFCNLGTANTKQKKPCFYTHINLCSGACKGQISHSDYNNMIGNLKQFLSGRRKTLPKSLKTQLSLAAKSRHFEHAAILRDQINAIKNLHTLRSSTLFDTNLPVIDEDKHHDRLTKLSSLLHLAGYVPGNYPIKRIEAYDVSNTQGTNSTASMVVFQNGKPDTGEYRKFKIRTFQGPNDVGMLKETLSRRLKHIEWTLPQLIIIDGGKNQLKAATSITLHKIPTISIAKNPDRLLIPQRAFPNSPPTSIKLNPGHPISNLVQQLRDESHRFAKAYHKVLRSKALTNSLHTKV